MVDVGARAENARVDGPVLPTAEEVDDDAILQGLADLERARAAMADDDEYIHVADFSLRFVVQEGMSRTPCRAKQLTGNCRTQWRGAGGTVSKLLSKPVTPNMLTRIATSWFARGAIGCNTFTIWSARRM